MDVDTDTPAAFLSRDIVPGDVLKMVKSRKKVADSWTGFNLCK